MQLKLVAVLVHQALTIFLSTWHCAELSASQVERTITSTFRNTNPVPLAPLKDISVSIWLPDSLSL